MIGWLESAVLRKWLACICSWVLALGVSLELAAQLPADTSRHLRADSLILPHSPVLPSAGSFAEPSARAVLTAPAVSLPALSPTAQTEALEVKLAPGALSARLRRALQKNLALGLNPLPASPSTPKNDSLMARTAAQKAVAALQEAGYPLARLDTVMRERGHSFIAHYSPGPLYLLDSLSLVGVGPEALAEAGFDPTHFTHQPLYWPGLEQHLGRVLHYYVTQGLAFARLAGPEVAYRSHGRDSVGVTVTYHLHPGKLVTIDSVVAVGKIREKDRFIQTLTQLKPGQLYNPDLIANAPRALNNSIYYQNARAAQVRFHGPDATQATIHLPLEPKKSNRFDLVLGFLPPQAGGTGWQFTGLLDLLLVSALRTGEVLHLQYNQLPSNARTLDLHYLQPSLLGTPFKAELNFTLQQQDTLFLTRNFEPTGYYAFTPHFSLKAFYKNRVTSLLAADVYRNTPLPPFLDGSSNWAGIGVVYDDVDYKPNPAKGIQFSTSIAIGTKTLHRTVGLDSLATQGLLNSQASREYRLKLDWYHTVRRRQVLVLANQSYWLEQKQYFQNDLAQTGGALSLRGFNENQFYTNAYSIFTAEYRLLLEQNSYLGGFVDYGYLHFQSVGQSAYALHAVGVGFSLAVQTGAGVVSVSYAVGQSEQQPFQPERGRIHIGFVSQF